MREETPEERRARWRSVAVSASAMPTRRSEAKEGIDRTKRWQQEHDAARTIVKHGEELKSLTKAPEHLRALEMRDE